MERDEGEIVRLYIEEGLNGPQIAARVGLGATTVYRVLHRNGVDAQNRRWSLYYDELQTSPQRLIDDYQAGASLAEVADRHGVSNLTVRNVLARHGIPRRRVGGRNRPLDEAETERAVELRRKGLPLDDIAAEMHRGLHHIRTALEPLGLHRRFPPQRKPRVNTEGYVRVWVPDDDPMRSMSSPQGWVAEHRLVMARSMGRPLSPDETVHHRNGDPGDNRIENLQLRQGNHGKGVQLACRDCGSHNIEAVDL